jgi:phosphoribosyl 1,2-cyclic phosphate phosphodiesterase
VAVSANEPFDFGPRIYDHFREIIHMIITILGCGTSTGVPMVGCSCSVCSSTDPRDKRTRASILVRTSGKYILVDTSPDLRRQAIREKIPHIDAVLFTHAHADHINGIDDLRGYHLIHKRVIPCFGDRETIDTISGKFSYIFEGMQKGGYTPLLEPQVISGTFTLFGHNIVPVPLVHGCSYATGYRIDDCAYLTDCSDIPESSLARLMGLEVLIIDALRYTPHPAHFNIEGAIRMVKKLKPGRAFFTHLTHEVSYGDGWKLPNGIELCYDGMTIEVKQGAGD